MSRYLNHRKLGDTRYSEVWACHDQAGNWFARKLLKATAPQVVLSRFVQEVRILSKLDHAHIIKVVDAGLDASPSWFVMPLYKSSLSAERAAIAAHPERIEPLFSRVLDAVEYAHREGVIHRDLKLDNILWNSDTELAVADFGIGRLLSATEGRMTDTRIGMGTEMYMAPEQAVDAKRADARSDVFSLGRVLYELHTGQQLTPVQDVSFLMQEVGEVIRKCTLADPAERYQSVGELKDAWRSASGRYTAVFQDATVPALIKQVAAQPGSTIPVKALREALSSPSLTPDGCGSAWCVCQCRPLARCAWWTYQEPVTSSKFSLST
jgi:serine/threonine protein kinase